MGPHTASSSFTAWLDQAVNRERSGRFAGMHLAAMRAVLRHLPAPPRPLTVAGTKGKGSTVRFIEAGLRGLGRTTVALTSPHVRSLNERWRIDGVPAAWEVLDEAAGPVAAAERAAGTTLSWFERTVAIAVVLAARRPGADLLLEVGLGGRLDAVNALDARVAVVTHLSHDHRDLLGPTLHHIAGEKLAIARPGCPLIIAPQSAEAATAVRARLADAAPGAWPVWAEAPQLPLPLAAAGDHQQANAGTAVAAIAAWLPGGDLMAAAAGMAGATLAARCQLVHADGRRILIDGAHNGPSVAAALTVARGQLAPGFTAVLGLATDKEADEIAAVLRGLPLVRCGYDSPRARGPADWPAALGGSWHVDIRAALAAIPGDLLVIGSFYLAGEALAALGVEDALPG